MRDQDPPPPLLPDPVTWIFVVCGSGTIQKFTKIYST